MPAPHHRIATENRLLAADMFASLASFSRAEGGGQLPGELQSPLQRFFAPQ